MSRQRERERKRNRERERERERVGSHLTEEVSRSNEPSKFPKISENNLLPSGDIVMMQTAQTEVSNQYREISELARLLMDFQRTYITESLADKLNLKAQTTEKI